MPIGKAAALLINLAIAGGGMAMQYLLTPKTQGTSSDQGKLDDIRITGSEYGALIPRVWGQARLGSNVIWSSGVRHEVIAYQSAGGKGATPATATTTHIYTADFGLQICRGPLQKVGRIWADSDIVNGLGDNAGMVEAEATTNVLAGGAAIQTDIHSSGGAYVKTLGSIDFTAASLASIIDPENPDSNATPSARSNIYIYYKCTVGTKLKVTCYDDDNTSIYSGVLSFSGTDDKWVPASITIKRDKTQNFKFVYRVKLEKNGSDASPDIDRITLTKMWDFAGQSASNIFSPCTGIKDPYVTLDENALDAAPYYNYFPPYTNGKSAGESLPSAIIATYLGTNVQPADDMFIEWLDAKYGAGTGVDYAMAYRDTALAVCYSYNLRSGRIPNYTFEVFEGSTTLGEVLPTILADCGLNAADYDISSVEDIEFVGIVEPPRQSKKSLMESIGTYFGFRMYESDGKLLFTLDDNFTSVGTIDPDILRARTEGEEQKPYDGEILCSPTSELPREVRFNVMNPLMDYHNDTVVAALFCDTPSSDSKDLNFPIIDYPFNARLRAENHILKLYSQGNMVTFKAMPEMLKYSLGDIVDVTLNDDEYQVRIEKMTIGLPVGVIEVEGMVIEAYDPQEIMVSVTGSGTTTESMAPKLMNPRNVKVIPMISLPIRGRDKGRLGCYVAVTPIGSGAIDNMALYREAGTDNFQLMDIIDVPPSCGLAEDTLGTHSDADIEDTTNTLDIYFYNTTSLESFTLVDLQRYPTLNLIRIGHEWIQFRTATLQSLPADSQYRSVWRISNLSRGRYGTAGAMASHSANEECVVWNDTIKFYDFLEEDIGETIVLKATSGGTLVEDAKQFDFTFNPVSKYTISNDTADRTLNANSTDMDELADVLSTLIRDTNL